MVQVHVEKVNTQACVWQRRDRGTVTVDLRRLRSVSTANGKHSLAYPRVLKVLPPAR